MSINYTKLSNANKPDTIKTLLIGEAPPPNSETYFYQPCQLYLNCPVENNRSLPATIFNHYFGYIANNVIEYQKFLDILKLNGIFLIDVHEEPLLIRSAEGLHLENVEKVRQQIPLLNERIKKIKGVSNETKIIFLMPRKVYNRIIWQYFKNPDIRTWKKFRMDLSEVLKY